MIEFLKRLARERQRCNLCITATVSVEYPSDIKPSDREEFTEEEMAIVAEKQAVAQRLLKDAGFTITEIRTYAVNPEE